MKEEFQKTQNAEQEPWKKVDLENMILRSVGPTNDSGKYDCKRIALGKYGIQFLFFDQDENRHALQKHYNVGTL